VWQRLVDQAPQLLPQLLLPLALPARSASPLVGCVLNCSMVYSSLLCSIVQGDGGLTSRTRRRQGRSDSPRTRRPSPR
jgi:hypothetical protein